MIALDSTLNAAGRPGANSSASIIFDLGGVVVTWQPRIIAAKIFADQDSQDRLLRQFVCHDDWMALDRGTLPRAEAIARGARRTGLSEADLDRFLRQVPLELNPIPETVDLMYRLKARGHHLYCLSNMHPEFIEHLERHCTFWDVFSGKVISCRLHLCKPEPGIYSYLLKTYGLDGAQTVFIDDTDVNLTAAARFGMQTIRFETPVQCENQLLALGCI